MRKIIQIAASRDGLFVLCDDGTVLHQAGIKCEWLKVPDILEEDTREEDKDAQAG